MADIVLLPEPFVTTTILKNADLTVAMNLTEEWDKAAEKEGKDSVLAMGAIIVREDFLKNNKAAFDKFLDEYKSSTLFTTEKLDESAALVEKYQILPSAAVAKKAIPNCNIVYIDGTDMATKIKPFYNILFDADPKSVGGKLPEDSFYYAR
jgi:NitT/TauT family transport system substrate-binding protein